MNEAIQFRIAESCHDEAIRELLRESSMSGEIHLSTRREPSYFQSIAMEHPESLTLIALLRGRVVCAGSVGIRLRYVNGEPVRVGYLGQLRLAASHAGRFDILRRGFRLFREHLPGLNLAACFTSVATDNHRARRFLEKGARGMPVYRPLAELVTLAVPVDPAPPADAAPPARPGLDDLEAFTASVNAANARYQLAPHWSSAQLRAIYDTGDAIACGDPPGALLWDQRSLKQSVITGYSARLGLLRPIYNLLAGLRQGTKLPRAGSDIASAFLSHLVREPEHGLVNLLPTVRHHARQRRLQFVLLGLDRRDSLCGELRRAARPREYHTTLYQLDWGAENPAFARMDDRLVFPEIALL